MGAEIWRDIDGYDGLYQVSNFGRVKSFKYKTPRILKLTPYPNGYLRVDLHYNGAVKSASVHRLVAEAFIPNPDGKPEVNHINGDKTDNHVENLEWATRTENVQHALMSGLTKQNGEDSSCAKLTNEQARFIRENPDGLTCTELARMFKVGEQTISRIQRGETYRNAGGTIRTEKLPHPPHIPKTTREQIRAEYKPGIRGHGSHALAKKFGVDHSTILNIIHGK